MEGENDEYLLDDRIATLSQKHVKSSKVLASIPFPTFTVGFNEPMVKMISQPYCQPNFACQASWPVNTLAPITLVFILVLVPGTSHQPRLLRPFQILTSLFHVA